MSGQQRGPRRHAPGADVGVSEPDAFGRESVDVGRLHPVPGFRVATDRPVGMVVSVDEEDVGTVVFVFPGVILGVRRIQSDRQEEQDGEGDELPGCLHEWLLLSILLFACGPRTLGSIHAGAKSLRLVPIRSASSLSCRHVSSGI